MRIPSKCSAEKRTPPDLTADEVFRPSSIRLKYNFCIYYWIFIYLGQGEATYRSRPDSETPITVVQTDIQTGLDRHHRDLRTVSDRFRNERTVPLTRTDNVERRDAVSLSQNPSSPASSRLMARFYFVESSGDAAPISWMSDTDPTSEVI
jgi:hypothetical protein